MLKSETWSWLFKAWIEVCNVYVTSMTLVGPKLKECLIY